MSQARLDDVAARLQNRVDRGLIPGAVILVARHGKTVLHKAFGVREVGKDTMTEDTLFDLESNTKVLSTAISYMILIEHNAVHLSDPVAKYLPHFATNGKAHVTIRDMLRYSSGLPVDIALPGADRKSTRLNSSHDQISYAVFCLKKKKQLYNSSDVLCIAHTERRCEDG